MKAKYLPLAILALTSCEKVAIDTDDAEVQMQFRIVTPSVTRAQSAADFKTLLIADIQNGTLQQLIRKSSTEADFASPTLSLRPGNHTLRFLATDADATNLQSPVATWTKTGDTFLRSVDVNTTNTATQTIVLNRIVAKVIWTGDGTMTLTGLPTGIDMATALPTTATTTTQLAKDAWCYSLVPKSGVLTLDNGNQVAIEPNTVTRITDRNGESTHDPIPGGSDQSTDEYLVLTTDTALLYVSNRELPDITLSETPTPHITLAPQLSPYRMPTRLEASELRKVALPTGYWQSAQRALCYDTPAHQGVKVGTTEYGTGEYYTFAWGSGSVSKAGQKTAYTITPIRSQPLAPISIPFTLNADFNWNSDTIKIGH